MKLILFLLAVISLNCCVNVYYVGSTITETMASPIKVAYASSIYRKPASSKLKYQNTIKIFMLHIVMESSTVFLNIM